MSNIEEQGSAEGRSRFTVKIDDQTFTLANSATTGRELLALVGRDPGHFFLVFLVPGEPDQIVELDEPFDLSAPGVEKLALVSRARYFIIYIDEERYRLDNALTNGEALLKIAGKCSCKHLLTQSLPNRPDEIISPDEEVDVSKPGVERFLTVLKDDVSIYLEVDDAVKEVVVRRGQVLVSDILSKAGLGTGYVLYQHREGGIVPLEQEAFVEIDGCERFPAQVIGGASS